MSQEFLNFISTLLQSPSIELSNVLDLILECNFSESQICDESIELFVQLNFTGPPDPTIESAVGASGNILRVITDDLACEGEVPFAKCKGLVLLWIAKSISEKVRRDKMHPDSGKSVYRSCIAYLKCIYMHQATLRDERSALLKAQMEECFAQAVQCKADDDSDRSIEAFDEFQLLMLASHLHLIFYEYRKAEELFRQCQSLLGVSTELKGALGKRTKFQVDNVSQLYLDISRDDTVTSARSINAALGDSASLNLPNDHLRDDEVLLDAPLFVDGAQMATQNAAPPSLAEQSVLALQAEIHKLSRAKDEVTMEECAAILLACANAPSSWPVATDVLLQRCQLSTRSSRRTERALMQLEELSTQFGHRLPPVAHRTRWFFLARLPAVWELQLRLARVLSAMGMTRSALDVLLVWDQWAGIIDCCIALGQRERAERVIRERIAADGETAELLCCLGDVTKQREHYERAWVVSKQRSARAMRSLAIHHMFVDSNHEAAAECFEASLRINPLQVNAWFTYGCCCLAMTAYAKAAAAFKQCLSFEPDNFEAWNNCASAMVELGDKKRALALLKEATKYSYENWRLWDNICIVSAAVGDFAATVKAYHRVMDLRQQHRDPATLATMVNAVTASSETDGIDKLRPKLKELFERIASKDGRDPRIWTIYADLLANDADQSDEMRLKVLQCLSRAHHGMCPSGWEADNTQCRRALVSALRLVDMSLQYDISYSSAKLAIKSVKAILQNRRSNQLEELNEEVRTLLAKIDDAEAILADKL